MNNKNENEINERLVCEKCKNESTDLHLFNKIYVCADCYDVLYREANNIKLDERYCPFCKSNEITMCVTTSTEIEYEWNIETGKWVKSDERDLDDETRPIIICQHCNNEFDEDDILIDLKDFDQTWGNLDDDQLVSYDQIKNQDQNSGVQN